MRVAIIGASNDRAKYGNKAVRSYVAQGHEVLPVNPSEQEIEGLAAYKSVAEIEGGIDRVLLYVPPAVGLKVLEGLAGRDIPEIFVNPGAESSELFSHAAELGLKVIFACAIVDIGESPARYS